MKLLKLSFCLILALALTVGCVSQPHSRNSQGPDNRHVQPMGPQSQPHVQAPMPGPQPYGPQGKVHQGPPPPRMQEQHMVNADMPRPVFNDTRKDIVNTLNVLAKKAAENGDMDLFNHYSERLLQAEVAVAKSEILERDGRTGEAMEVLNSIIADPREQMGEREKAVMMVKELENRRDELELEARRIEREKKEIDRRLEHIRGEFKKGKETGDKGPGGREGRMGKQEGRKGPGQMGGPGPEQREALKQKLHEVSKELKREDLTAEERKRLEHKRERIKNALEETVSPTDR